MAAAVAEVEAGLQAMLSLKAPGISGSRINAITNLCVANVQSESVLVQKLYIHFKKAPGTHKLGVLYVVDSVTRKWMDQAKQNGQAVTNASPDGTYGAGVNRVTELMPVLMADIIQNAPQDQKEKIKKLVDIWEKGQTFPMKMIEDFKSKLNNESFTPPGSPPPSNVMAAAAPKPAPPMVVPNNIMEALANIARQNAAKANDSRPSVPSTAPLTGTPGSLAAVTTPMPPFMSAAQPPPFLPAAQAPAPPVASVPTPFTQAQQPIVPPVPMPGFPMPGFPMPNGLPVGSAPVPPPVFPAAMPPPAGDSAAMQLQLLQTLLAQGVPIDKITAIIASLSGTTAPVAPTPPPLGQFAAPLNGAGWNAPKPEDSRNANGFDGLRSPNRNRGRSRSRSPRRWDGGRDDRRNGRNSPGDRDGKNNNNNSDYRQRSPDRRQGNNDSGAGGEKWIDFDPSLGNGFIKVLSRTLFVGGVTCSEAELRNVFSRFGNVQTCIVNKEKRHAFVKMYTRKEAVAAKEGMETNRTGGGGMDQMRTRWGVGFGPRDCSDYQTGVSVIPIHKLTDADRKWMLQAVHGGSGGKSITTGMVVEEPDIEIGAGVSSKAISRRMQTDKGGSMGPKSGDDYPASGMGDRGMRGQQQQQHRGRDSGNDNHVNGGGGGAGGDGAVQFPFGITMGPNGMPIFPPGFTFPGQPSQAPGRF